jgi:hypothetical protein
MKLVVDVAAAFSCLRAAHFTRSVPLCRWGEGSHHFSPPFKLCPKKVLHFWRVEVRIKEDTGLHSCGNAWVTIPVGSSVRTR